MPECPADFDGAVTGLYQGGCGLRSCPGRDTGPFAGQPGEFAGVLVECRFQGVGGTTPRVCHPA
ncbi:hypothetical protein [Nocardia carnea]|uniref:hypothetical protein n=1 Tax=Nocardia carnea TaxID=37328 RepID=UPI0012DF0D7D|nr:hypothetical protein [Nocardia carnea]